ncbi:MAG: ribokinase [Spirochaetales bacterium]|nr:ribokinase [Spirochaetales bacterium]
MIKSDVCVVGASNIDLISYIPRLPVEGETLHGTEFRMGFGGKGANQAVMAAKLNANVSMVTKLGDDVFGKQTLENFQNFGVNTDKIYFTKEAFSGVAPISVDSDGKNSIIIVTGANDLLSVDNIQSAKSTISSSKVLVCQMEIPVEISISALKIAKEAGVLTIFNPAPARNNLPGEIYGLIDIISPNETEVEILTGVKINSIKDAEDAGKLLVKRGVETVIITLGEKGSMLVTKDGGEYFQVDSVDALDSTGAGDAFIGSLAMSLAKGRSLSDSIIFANKIAGISVQNKGTQTSFPAISELPDELILGY